MWEDVVCMVPNAQPRSLLIKPASGDCNLHCRYCFYHDRAGDPYKERQRHRMSHEVLDALIRQGMRLNPDAAAFGWQGGEPTLSGLDFFREVVELQKRYGRPGQAVSNGLQTNGILLTPEWARFLREYHFLLGVSLDGPPEYHDHYRTYPNGRPTHAQVVQTLRMLEENQVEYNILTVVNRYNGDHAAEIWDYLVSQGYRYLQFIPCVETDPETGQVTDFSVSSEQFGDFLCAVFDHWYNEGNPEISVRDFDATLSIYMGQGAPLCCYQEQCGGYVVVEFNGDVYPCDFMVREDLYLGNILETPLQEIFVSDGLQRFARHKAEPRQECANCAWYPLCMQGCPRFVNADGSGQHYLCGAYKRFFTYSHDRFVTLRDRLLIQQGRDPRRAPRIPQEPIRRNDPCPCGSGLKYKACCGRGGRR